MGQCLTRGLTLVRNSITSSRALLATMVGKASLLKPQRDGWAHFIPCVLDPVL
jgi:hypothetical protein